MRTILAFLHGMYEFRSDMTTSYGDDLIEAYDWGREWAHRLTCRRFDSAALVLAFILALATLSAAYAHPTPPDTSAPKCHRDKGAVWHCH